MVLDKDGSVLIESSSLAELLEQTTGHLNQLAGRVTATKGAVASHSVSSQVVDLYCDIKNSEGRGGQRKALRYYDLASARELVSRRPEAASDLLGVLEWLTPPPQRVPRAVMLAVLMARRPVSKELWRQLQPLIPAFVPSAKGGARKLSVSDEAALNGILFVLQTGIPWEDLPQSLGYGSGMTCWRRLRDWNAAGVWEQLHQAS